jgi:transmembrane sensor
MKENPYGHLDEGAYRIAYLIAGYVRQTLTEKEHDELDDWITADDKNMQLFEELTDEKNIEANLAWMDKVKSKQSYEALQQAGKFKRSVKRFILSPIWIAAASIVLLVGAFFIFRNTNNGNANNSEMASSDTIKLKPGGNRAILTFEDGSMIDLTKAKNGLMKNDNGADIIKLSDGILMYDPHNADENLSAVHTLSTPVGGQYQVTLPDGTKVWLNAATTLKYPSRFITGERKVEVHGEAYFEVAKDEKKPFRVVLTDSTDLVVLGTHFNVMSYNNEKIKEITLLEGSVKISQRSAANGMQSAVIKPGQQVVLTHNSPFTIHDNIDSEEITGWKDGWFVFHDAPIELVMRQVERWYDAKIVYKGEIKELFNATILRKEPLSKLLHYLETNGYVHFKVENKTIYVLP